MMQYNGSCNKLVLSNLIMCCSGLYRSSMFSIEKQCEQGPCTMHTSHYSVSSHCTLHTAHYKPHTTHCTLHIKHCTLHTTNLILHTTHCTLHTAHYTLHTSYYIAKVCVLWSVHTILSIKI